MIPHVDVIVLVVIAFLQALTTWLTQRNEDKAAKRQQEVKDALVHSDNKTALAVAATSSKLEAIAKVADNTHTLVNNQMGIQLALNATTARSLANLTNDVAHKQAADTAEEKLREHLKRQAVMDLTPAPPASRRGE